MDTFQTHYGGLIILQAYVTANCGNVHILIIFYNKQLSPTWGKVYCRIKTLKSSTFQMKLACTISCEQHHLIPKMLAKDLQKGTQIVIVTSKVASILILHLHSKSKSAEQ